MKPTASDQLSDQGPMMSLRLMENKEVGSGDCERGLGCTDLNVAVRLG